MISGKKLEDIDIQMESVKLLTIKVRRMMDGMPGGEHISLHRGVSVEFEENKKYYPGEDIKNLDWKALARTDKYFVKQFQREVNLDCLLISDQSSSMNYCGKLSVMSKHNYATTLLGSIAYIILRQQDAVGLITFDEKILKQVPVAKKPNHLINILNALIGTPGSSTGYTGFNKMVAGLPAMISRRSLIVLASDLWGADDVFLKSLTNLSTRGHDVVVFLILDPDELNFPFYNPAVFQSLEKEPLVVCNPSFFRKDYVARVEELISSFKTAFDKAGIEFILVSTKTLPHKALWNFSMQRKSARGTQ